MSTVGSVVGIGAARPVIGRAASSRVSRLSGTIVTDNTARALPYGPSGGRRQGPRVFGRQALTG